MVPRYARLGLGDEAQDAWYGGGEEFSPPVVPAESYPVLITPAPAVSPSSQGNVLVTTPQVPVGTSIFGQLLNSLTQTGPVNAALNKYVFGNTGAIPTAYTQYPVAVPGQWISGIPNSYLVFGGLAVVALMAAKKGRR